MVTLCTLCSERWDKMPCRACGDVAPVWMLIQIVPGAWDRLCGACSDVILAASAEALRQLMEDAKHGTS
jgi:hypothetical protein